MSIGRNHPSTNPGLRDAEADYLAAHIDEYECYTAAGMTAKAAEVAAVLRALGHEIRPERPAAGQRERAVAPEPLERAVDSEVKRRPGRPKKSE